MNGHPSIIGDSFGRAGGFNDVGMRPHPVIMQYALHECKRLLHYDCDYPVRMTPNERLRIARAKAGFDTATDAALALGIPRGTYIGHENGHRGFPATRAPQYAKKFKVSEEWLLYGKGPEATNDPEPSVPELTEMLAEAMKGLPIGTTIADLPRYVAPTLRELLELYRVGGGFRKSPEQGTSLDKDAQSPPSTRRVAAA